MVEAKDLSFPARFVYGEINFDDIHAQRQENTTEIPIGASGDRKIAALSGIDGVCRGVKQPLCVLRDGTRLHFTENQFPEAPRNNIDFFIVIGPVSL